MKSKGYKTRARDVRMVELFFDHGLKLWSSDIAEKFGLTAAYVVDRRRVLAEWFGSRGLKLYENAHFEAHKQEYIDEG